MGRSRMSDAAFWAVCFLAIGVVVSLCVGAAALARDMNAMNRAYRTAPGRAVIRAGWRVGLFERYRRRRCSPGLKRIGYPLHLYSSDFDEPFPSYTETPGDPVDGAPAAEGAARQQAEAEGRAEQEPPSAGSGSPSR